MGEPFGPTKRVQDLAKRSRGWLEDGFIEVERQGSSGIATIYRKIKKV